MGRCLTIVGVGPGDKGLRSVAAQAALDGAQRIVLRTAVHPGVEDLAGDPRTVACDDLYLDATSFQALYVSIVERVLSGLDRGDIVYAVPGSPMSGEHTVRALRTAAAERGHVVEVVPGVGGLDVVAGVAGLDLMADSVQVVDATLLAAWLDAHPFGGWLLPLAPQRPVVITQVYNREMLASVSAALSSLYPDQHPIVIVGWDDRSATPCRRDTNLLELDDATVDHLTSVVVPPVVDAFTTRSPFTLDQVVAHLRSPDGCPWDRELTNTTLAPFAVEEAFEVVDAVAGGDQASFADELGDLLLQPVMQAQVAAEIGAFDLADVFEAITDKLIRRHPHVFAEERADSPTEVMETWRRVKAAEGRPPKPASPYDRLPTAMPPSMKVAKALKTRGDLLDEGEASNLARTIAGALVRLTEAGYDADRLVDAECRILVDRALSTATRKD